MKVSQGAFDKIYQESFEIALESKSTIFSDATEEEVKEIFKKMHPYALKIQVTQHDLIIMLAHLFYKSDYKIFEQEEIKKFLTLDGLTGDQKVRMLINHMIALEDM